MDNVCETQGMFTGLLGNLSLLSYFVKKRETEVIVVQTLGVVSIYIVISQLAMAEAMPFPYFVATSAVVATGLVLNFLKYFERLNVGLWRFWEDFITVAGLSALPQVSFFSLFYRTKYKCTFASSDLLSLLFIYLCHQGTKNIINLFNIFVYLHTGYVVYISSVCTRHHSARSNIICHRSCDCYVGKLLRFCSAFGILFCFWSCISLKILKKKHQDI